MLAKDIQPEIERCVSVLYIDIVLKKMNLKTHLIKNTNTFISHRCHDRYCNPYFGKFIPFIFPKTCTLNKKIVIFACRTTSDMGKA